MAAEAADAFRVVDGELLILIRLDDLGRTYLHTLAAQLTNIVKDNRFGLQPLTNEAQKAYA